MNLFIGRSSSSCCSRVLLVVSTQEVHSSSFVLLVQTETMSARAHASKRRHAAHCQHTAGAVSTGCGKRRTAGGESLRGKAPPPVAGLCPSAPAMSGPALFVKTQARRRRWGNAADSCRGMILGVLSAGLGLGGRIGGLACNNGCEPLSSRSMH